MNRSIQTQNDAKDVFKKCETCSRTFAYLLNREFDYPMTQEERALNPLAGGILNQGYQCGMLWGAVLAIGAAAFRKHKDLDKSMVVAVNASQDIITSFVETSGATNCKDLIGYDLTTILGMTKFMINTTLKGMNNSHCFNLAEQWAPKAIETATYSLSQDITMSEPPSLCTAEVLKQMNANDEEIAMVAGFAGGLGLSGNACGALSAAIWKRMLDWCREHPDKSPPFFNNKIAKKILKTFNKTTENNMLCSDICGKTFKDLKAHSDYIKQGGCKALIKIMATTH